MLTISGRSLGQKKPLFADYQTPVPPAFYQPGNNQTLRDLLTAIVHAEVEAYDQRQYERKFLKVLSATEIANQAKTGKIESGGREPSAPVDVEVAVATALQAFEDGLFLAILDEQEQTDLDAPVYLQPDSQMVFIKLVMLAGG